MPTPRLILASGSPQRRQLLAAAGYEFEIFVPDDSAECGICSNGGPASLVAELALRKATDVARRLADAKAASAIVLACDTVAECGGEVLGKPTDEEHARSMLERLRGKVHRVYSGLCVFPFPDGPPETRVAITELRMDNIANADLDDYLASDLWRGKAGAFGYQDRVGWLHILKGSESNVIGLPMELLKEMIS